MSEQTAIHATARRRAPGLRPGPLVRLREGLPGGGHPLEELLDLLKPAVRPHAGAHVAVEAEARVGLDPVVQVVAAGQVAGLLDDPLDADYAAPLSGYGASVLVRKLKRSTRGATLQPLREPRSNRVKVDHVFSNEASVAFSYDYFEAGLGDGPATWRSVGDDTLAVLRSQASRLPGRHCLIRQGSATALPLAAESVDAVITDPPYEDMIDYSDASDLFYVWLKRALVASHPDLALTADPRGLQEKADEIIVKRGGAAVGDHRTREFYDNDEAEAKRERDQDGIPAAVAVRYLRDLAETWRAAEGGRGRRMLAEALFERIEARGFTELTMRLTDSAIAHGFAAAIPERLELFVAYGRGERACASLTHQPLHFLMINRTPIEGRDDRLAAARRLA